jgi:hypothetical protein
MGMAGSLDIIRGTGTTNRRWKIKVSFIECSNPSRSVLIYSIHTKVSTIIYALSLLNIIKLKKG